MKIEIVTAEELGSHMYQELEPGIHHCPGRLVVLDQGSDQGFLIVRGKDEKSTTSKQK